MLTMCRLLNSHSQTYGGFSGSWVRGKYRKCSTSPFPLLFTSLHFHHITPATPLTSSPVLFPPSRVVMTKLFISNVWHFALCRSPERMNAPRFSKEHLVISQLPPPPRTPNTLGMGINTCCTLTHTEHRGAFEWSRGSAFSEHIIPEQKKSQLLNPAPCCSSFPPSIPSSCSTDYLESSLIKGWRFSFF